MDDMFKTAYVMGVQLALKEAGIEKTALTNEELAAGIFGPIGGAVAAPSGERMSAFGRTLLGGLGGKLGGGIAGAGVGSGLGALANLISRGRLRGAIPGAGLAGAGLGGLLGGFAGNVAGYRSAVD